ncbi:hypothetical protein AYY26_02980 [Photobacterium phosphoreum]|nr:hypothetical protein AYY26_02980 [Photobacterium phosphoreum]
MYILYDDISFFLFITLIIISILMYSMAPYINNKIDCFFVFIISIVFICLCFYKNGLGVDELSYLNAYKLYEYRDFKWGLGFYLLYGALHFLGVNNEYFNVSMQICYLIVALLMVVIFVKKDIKSLCLLYVLFTYWAIDFEFNLYRQGFASLFILMAILSYKRSWKNCSYFLFIVAISFHWSSCLIFIIFLLSIFSKQLPYKKILIFINIIIVLMFLHKFGIFEKIVYFISGLSFDSSFIKAVNDYYLLSKSKDMSIYDMSFFGRLPLVIMILSFSFISSVIYKKNNFILFIFIYCLLFLEMPYSFRNLYWLFILYPILISDFRDFKSNTSTIRIFTIFYILIQIPLYFFSGIIPLILT